MLLDLDEIHDLKERFANTHPDFQTAISRLSERSLNLQPLGVYALWRKYSQQCDHADQSAVFSEFIRWYAKDLAIADINEVTEYAMQTLA